MDKSQLDFVSVGGMTFVRATLQPGWKWSTSIKPVVKSKTCEAARLGYQVSGRLHVVADDGSEVDIGAGDVYSIPPGHDAWVVGNEPVVAIDVRGQLADFARP